MAIFDRERPVGKRLDFYAREEANKMQAYLICAKTARKFGRMFTAEEYKVRRIDNSGAPLSFTEFKELVRARIDNFELSRVHHLHDLIEAGEKVEAIDYFFHIKKSMDNKPTGLGDSIERFTEATGIKQVIKRFTKATGIDCGCDKRKEILNELFPYQKPACMNRAQHSVWQEFKENRGAKITSPEQEMVARMHSDLFHHKFTKPCTCSPKKWNEWIRDIDRIFETYGKATSKDA